MAEKVSTLSIQRVKKLCRDTSSLLSSFEYTKKDEEKLKLLHKAIDNINKIAKLSSANKKVMFEFKCELCKEANEEVFHKRVIIHRCKKCTSRSAKTEMVSR